MLNTFTQPTNYRRLHRIQNNEHYFATLFTKILRFPLRCAFFPRVKPTASRRTNEIAVSDTGPFVFY